MNTELSPDARVTTERLVLRPLAAGDADAIFALFDNWDVVRYLSAPPWPYAVDDARTYLAAITGPDSNETAFAITLDGGLIGGITMRLRPKSNLQRADGPDVGYWLGHPYWGRGYMTEAVRGLVRLIFDACGCDEVYSGAFSDNKASLRIQEKVGFVVDGHTTLFSRPRNGTYPHTNTVLTRARFETFVR